MLFLLYLIDILMHEQSITPRPLFAKRTLQSMSSSPFPTNILSLVVNHRNTHAQHHANKRCCRPSFHSHTSLFFHHTCHSPFVDSFKAQVQVSMPWWIHNSLCNDLVLIFSDSLSSYCTLFTNVVIMVLAPLIR